jgi:anti-anti-sigma factor
MSPTEGHPASIHLSDGLVSAMGRPGSSVRVVVERRGSVVLFCAGGAVDASNVDIWRRMLGEAAQATVVPGPLIVDTSRLEFMGLCAFAVLAEESSRCRRRDTKLCLVSNHRIAARIVAAAGLESELSFYPTVNAALEAHHGGDHDDSSATKCAN